MGRNDVQSNFAMNTKCLFNLLCHQALLGTHSFSGIVNLLNCIDNGRALSHFGLAEKAQLSHVSPLKGKNEGKRAFRLTGSAQPEKIDVPSVDRILIVHSSHELNEMIVPPKHCFQPRIHRWFIYDWVFGLGETDIHFYSNNRGSFNYVIQIWLIAKTQFDPLLPKVNFGTFSSACSSIYHNLPLKHRQKRKMCVYIRARHRKLISLKPPW